MTNEEIQLAKTEIDLFLDIYNISNDQGFRLDFKDHAYLYDIYEDFSPQQVILKAAQIGFSTMANIKALWLAKNKGMDIIYSLPSASDIKDFVSGKTNRLIDYNTIFQKWTTDKDSIEQKRVGNNVIYFKGTWTERAAIATPADLYISDETDRSKQDVVQQYKTRLQHSKFGWEWYFSNPSVPGIGVDKIWAESDQCHWFIKCDCGHEWYLTLDNIQYNPQPYFGCLKCHKELDRHQGRWIAKHQGKKIRGYWIPLLVVPTKSAQYILDKKKEYSEEQFANFIMGQPYIGKGNVLTKQMFLQNLTDRINPQDARVLIGVDTGNSINLIAGNKYGLFYNSKTEDYGELRSLMKRWTNAVCVIDAGGDFRGAKSFREEFPNRVFLCYFRQDRKNDEVIQWSEKDDSVVVDRSKIIQLVVDELIEKRIPIYGTTEDWYDPMIEFLGMYRTSELNNLQVPTFVWNKPSSGRCDFPFAMVYWRVGMSKFIEQSSQFIEPKSESSYGGMDVSADGKTGFLPKL